MQTQQYNIHVKVQCENEFRRFVLAEVTYSNLAQTIRSLLAFSPETVFKLSYLDDEGDWVLFATDSELQYACGITKSPLKIQVKICTPVATPSPQAVKFTLPVGDEQEEEKPWKAFRGRGGRGCRGGRGGAMRGERIDAKIARLTDRHATLSAKMIENDLPEEKARGLEWRLSHLQNKIDTLKLRKEQLGDATAVPKEELHQEAPVQETARADGATPFPEDCEEDREKPWKTRGGCRRGGRGGGWRRQQEFAAGEQEGEERRCGGGPQAFACSTPEGKAAFDKVLACKEAVMAARRDKAGKEEILKRIEELKEAKANWKDLKMALWKENRAALAACPKKEAK
jgi:hypothetical protein